MPLAARALSVVVVEIVDSEDQPRSPNALSQLLDLACRTELPENTLIEVNSASQPHAHLASVGSSGGDQLAHDLIRSVENSSTSGWSFQGTTSVGVASVTLPSKNFRPVELLHTAERCLAAAQNSETSVVKSLEIY